MGQKMVRYIEFVPRFVPPEYRPTVRIFFRKK